MLIEQKQKAIASHCVPICVSLSKQGVNSTNSPSWAAENGSNNSDCCCQSRPPQSRDMQLPPGQKQGVGSVPPRVNNE